MASNNVINLIGLDFDNLKFSFIEYLKNQQQFKDYDFAGSTSKESLDMLSNSDDDTLEKWNNELLEGL